MRPRIAVQETRDELREEETLIAIDKMITAKLEAASQAVRESGEAVDKLVADLTLSQNFVAVEK